MRELYSKFFMVTGRLVYYFHIWWIMSRNSFQSILYVKVAFLIFLIGKILRFGFFIGFIYFLIKGTGSLADYSLNQTIFFFLTFNLIDITTQFLFREVYRFRPMVVSGRLDLVLVKPVNALFRVLMGGADIIDLITIPPLLISLLYIGNQLNPTFFQVVLYIVLVANGLMIATAFHIAVLAMGIITLEIDHTIMIFRDTISLGKFPVEIYREPIRSILTYLIPIGIMISLPTKALIGLASLQAVVISLILGIGSIFLSVKFWNYSLKFYSSASS